MTLRFVVAVSGVRLRIQSILGTLFSLPHAFGTM